MCVPWPSLFLLLRHAFVSKTFSLLFFILLLLFIALGLLSLGLLFLSLFFLCGIVAVVVRGLSVDSLTDLERRILQTLKAVVNLVGVLRDDGLVKSRDVTCNLIFNVLGNAGGVLLELLLGVVNELVSLVLEVNDTLEFLIGLFGALSLCHHTVDVGVGKTAAGSDRDVLDLTS